MSTRKAAKKKPKGAKKKRASTKAAPKRAPKAAAKRPATKRTAKASPKRAAPKRALKAAPKRAATKRTAKASPKRAAPRRAPKAAPKRSVRQAGPSTTPEPGIALRPLPVYEFTAGGLLGYVRLADPERGLEFSRCLHGKALPANCREVLSLRHYLARQEGGLLVPRDHAECSGTVEPTGAIFRYGKAPKWPVSASARYELLPQGGLDVTFTFDFDRGISGFEAGVETLLSGGQLKTYVHAGGRWIPASAGPRLQRFYPRNLGAAELIADGRWNPLRMAGVGLAVEPSGYDYPILVVWEGHTGWALTYMALTEECSAVWVNGAERAIGLGLVGADVKARSSVTCRARVLLCQAPQMDDVLPRYREFVQQARSTRRR